MNNPFELERQKKLFNYCWIMKKRTDKIVRNRDEWKRIEELQVSIILVGKTVFTKLNVNMWGIHPNIKKYMTFHTMGDIRHLVLPSDNKVKTRIMMIPVIKLLPMLKLLPFVLEPTTGIITCWCHLDMTIEEMSIAADYHDYYYGKSHVLNEVRYALDINGDRYIVKDEDGYTPVHVEEYYHPEDIKKYLLIGITAIAGIACVGGAGVYIYSSCYPTLSTM